MGYQGRTTVGGNAMILSVLVPIYNERDSIVELHRQVTAVMRDQGYEYELILADDGSSDGSAAVLDALADQDAAVKVVHLRRNFGQTAALMAAIDHSCGDVLIPMDGDLQNDPADIPRLLAKLDEGYDVVSGWRLHREDRLVSRRLPSVAANWLISRVLGVKLHDFGCTLKAYRRDVLADVRLYGEMHRFIPIFAAAAGGEVAELEVNHRPRCFGTSKYGIGRVARVLLDLLFLHFLHRSLDRPIQFFGKIGMLTMLMAVLTFLLALWWKVVDGVSLILTPLPLLAATLGLSGMLFVLMGIQAEVISRTYYESQGKRPYAVRRTRNLPAPPVPPDRRR